MKNEISGIVGRIRNRDFSGDEGTAIKNSSWQITTTLITKMGSLLFTIIIARLMLPEVYGLYGLALSTILLMGFFSNFGISAALMTFLSRSIDKKPDKARGYFYLLTKYKVFLTIFSSLLLLVFANWIANSYYNKPIYYALLAGVIYLPITIFSQYLNPLFTSRNIFYPQVIRELIVQISRLVIIPLSIIYFLSKLSSVQLYLLWIFILLSLCYLFGGIYLFIAAKSSHPFRRTKATKLNKAEKKELLLFIMPLSITAMSGIFFGYIDQIMLGHYVASQFLGFYQVAFNTIASISVLISFGSAAVFPIFARRKGEKLERGFRRTRSVIFLISILVAIFSFLIAPLAIKIIYGTKYLTAIGYMQLLSLLIISFPLIGLYTSYYTSQKRTVVISTLLVISTILNIVLNYVFINFGLTYSMSYAVMGACVATIISRYFYLAGMVLWRRR